VELHVPLGYDRLLRYRVVQLLCHGLVFVQIYNGMYVLQEVKYPPPPPKKVKYPPPPPKVRSFLILGLQALM
jgi:hypothetical protein